MKLIKYTIAATLLSGTASAQGLFDVNPNETISESLPLKYTVGLNFGYDDNVNPTSLGPEESSSYLNATLGANLVVRNEQTSWDMNAMVGATNYFDDSVANNTTYNASLALNLNHRLNERIRFVSRNFFNYGLDLGNFYGSITARDIAEYTFFSTDNSIGYRWTERLGTYTGVAFSAISYEGSARDVNSYGIYNQFRYLLDQQNTLTTSLRYTLTDFNVGDTDRLTASVGIERRISDVASVTAQLGAQFANSTSAYGSINYNYQVNTQLRARAFARYSQEDTDTVFLGGRYENKTSLRIGAAADYTLSPEVTLTLGGAYTMSDFKDGGILADGDWNLFNIYVSISYNLNDALSLIASANHTTSDATIIPNRDYDRNRYQLGVNYSF
jgi:hypothetical protein